MQGQGLKTIGLMLPIRAWGQGSKFQLNLLGRDAEGCMRTGRGEPLPRGSPEARSPKSTDGASAHDTPVRKPCGCRSGLLGPRAVRWRAVLSPRLSWGR